MEKAIEKLLNSNFLVLKNMNSVESQSNWNNCKTWCLELLFKNYLRHHRQKICSGNNNNNNNNNNSNSNNDDDDGQPSYFHRWTWIYSEHFHINQHRWLQRLFNDLILVPPGLHVSLFRTLKHTLSITHTHALSLLKKHPHKHAHTLSQVHLSVHLYKIHS